ncbi:hypothetical protein [Methylibium sp.]|uniref:hypothetical protein n=1 Tax=Methylibium sp. TaxID=2067992 RepID=UPI003D0A7230
MNDTELLVRLAYVCVTGALLWSMVCRVNKMSAATTKRWVRALYALVGAAVFGAMTLPFWRHDWAQWGALTLACTHLVTTVANSRAWRYGPPEHARSRPAPLDPAPEQ